MVLPFKDKSKNHHWWPVGLQRYWADRNGDVAWIEPDGKSDKKRADSRKIGSMFHGHTAFKGSFWETNFESEFDIDNEVHRVVDGLRALKPLGRTPSEFLTLLRFLFKRNRSLRDMCKFYQIDEKLHRNLLLFILSLLIRSPAARARYENYPSILGLPSDEEVGKMNMRQTFKIAKNLCREGYLSNQYFVLIHSPIRKFVFGDGSLDWLTNGLNANRLDGRVLIPLTPHICVYFCTPRSMRTYPNCASFSAAPWIVDWINDITQIYARDKLFYKGKPPKLSDAFRRRQFLVHSEYSDELIDMLDDVAGNNRNRILLGFERF
jgi:hypothetical protein